VSLEKTQIGYWISRTSLLDASRSTRDAFSVHMYDLSRKRNY